ISELLEYEEYIKSTPSEYKPIFNAILGGESLFFRDPGVWNFVTDSILPEIIQASEENKIIRIWSVGCSNGEEPYSIAIMLAETLKEDLAKYNVRVYATDIDESALKIARSGIYTLDHLSELPEHVKKRYFIRHGDMFIVSNEIKRLLIFSRHNIVSDPPISNIDLLLCRNVLIYLNIALRSSIIQKLRYALSNKGYLWLGLGETHIDSNVYGLKPLNTKWRIFKKTQYQDYYKPPDKDIRNLDAEPENLTYASEQNTTGVIILDKNYRVMQCNQFGYFLCFNQYPDHHANTFEMSDDRWKNNPLIELEQLVSFFDLGISDHIIDMKNRIEQAITNKEILIINMVEYLVSKDKRVYLKIEIIPTDNGVTIIIEDVTNHYTLQKKLQMTIESLEKTNENLVSANAVLKITIDELDIINEYLQSRNSEEIMVINNELMNQKSELEYTKLLSETIINSMDCGIIIFGNDLSINMVNQNVVSTFGIKRELINDKSYSSLNSNESLRNLVDQATEVMKTGKPTNNITELEDSKGSKLMVNVSIIPIIGEKVECVVLIRKER
ncbi:MAG: Protein-glutamate O-methyltransferase, partial [Candidatus Poribacteria bacterium]|nr:Protein-glutamate O-methyltransferase [Candidatus Poribacteria bacterium]